MSWPLYEFTYPKIDDVDTTTGYSGPIIIQENGEHINGFKDAIDSRNLVRAAIERILATSKGERVMLPSFGSNLKHLLFEPLDEFLIEDVKENLTTDIQLQEPRVIIDNINFIPDYENSSLNVSIDFPFRDGYKRDTYQFLIKY